MKTIFTTLILFLVFALNGQILSTMSEESANEENSEQQEDNSTVDNSDAIANFMRQGSITTGLIAGGAYYVGRQAINKGVDGEPYLDTEFKKSILLTKENKIIHVKGRYRVYDDQIEIITGKEQMDVFKDKVLAVGIGGQVFVPRKLLNKEGKIELHWLELISEGSLNLYKRYAMEIRRADYNPALNSGHKNDYLFLNTKMYYAKGDLTAKPKVLKSGRVAVLEALKKRKNAVNTYAKKERIKWSKEKDLKLLFDYYNSKDDK